MFAYLFIYVPLVYSFSYQMQKKAWMLLLDSESSWIKSQK